jgi:Deoxynucleotide monophosphate kinase
MEQTKVLGICGREGAGKNTVANILQFDSHLPNQDPTWELREIDNPLCYMAHVLFGFPMNHDDPLIKDPIWGMTQGKAYDMLSKLLIKYVDKDWLAAHPTGMNYNVPFPIQTSDNTWREFSMADPLKRICALIFDIPYKILLAQTPEDRKLRENTFSPQQSVCGAVTGRYCLEYFGTDVMRNNFDNDIWIKILKREASKTIDAGFKVVIPDIRFPNEGKLIDELDGTLLTIYRNPTDLDLTEEDQKTHPAKWKFLTFNDQVKHSISIHNDGSIDKLKELIRLA